MAFDIQLPPPHSQRVRAWVWAILNPAVEAVRRELMLLGKGNLSWHFYSKQCEYIRRFVEYTEPSQLPNFEDFLTDSLNAGFQQRISDHDTAVLQVEAAATRFFDGLMQSELFLKHVASALDEYRSRRQERPPEPDADVFVRNLPKFVAEYLINNVISLPNHYVNHKFWEEFQDRFDRSALEFEPYRQREAFQSLKRESDGLQHISESLLTALLKHRSFLCSTYDIPAAPFPVEISHSADPYITRSR